jgi:hypothetical protein
VFLVRKEGYSKYGVDSGRHRRTLLFPRTGSGLGSPLDLQTFSDFVANGNPRPTFYSVHAVLPPPIYKVISGEKVQHERGRETRFPTSV